MDTKDKKYALHRVRHGGRPEFVDVASSREQATDLARLDRFRLRENGRAEELSHHIVTSPSGSEYKVEVPQ